MTTAAHIILLNPNSVDLDQKNDSVKVRMIQKETHERPATCPSVII
jgi:hypothetical protein